MPQYKLTYYSAQGLAEPIRYMFAVAGVKYEDNRIPKNETTYPKLPQNIKDETPWGSVPVLEIDGKVKIGQSGAIMRFLAQRFKLAGADDIEAAKIDEIAEATKDFGTEFHSLIVEQDQAKKMEILKKLQATTIPLYMGKLNKIAETNGKWLVGANISWVDIIIAHYLTMMVDRSKMPIVDAFPAVKKLLADVFAVPQIKEWMAKRPDDE